jgi:glycosyltransferase involved in cell wall biosynthesis
MRIVRALSADHEVALACPPRGPLAEAAERASVDLLPIPAASVGLRLHPLRTPVGVAQLGIGGVALARAARRFGADVIHANTIRLGLMNAFARGLGSPPFIVLAHEPMPPTPVGRTVRSVILRTASAVVANSDYTAGKWNQGLSQPIVTRVHSSIDPARFDPERVQPAPIREELGIAPSSPLLGHVAQITPWKGQDTSIRTLALLRRDGLDAHLVIVGDVLFAGKEVRYDNLAYRRSLERLAGELGVRDHVHFLGQRDDAPAILRAVDLSLLPSWEEPFGLVTVESMALRTPPLVSNVGAGPELVEDGISGRLLPPRLPERWAAAAAELLRDRASLECLAANGPRVAARFRDDHLEMLAIYERVAARSGRRA